MKKKPTVYYYRIRSVVSSAHVLHHEKKNVRGFSDILTAIIST